MRLMVFFASFIRELPFQATKDGNFRGGPTYSHDVDVVIEAKNGEASTEKSLISLEIRLLRCFDYAISSP